MIFQAEESMRIWNWSSAFFVVKKLLPGQITADREKAGQAQRLTTEKREKIER